MFEGGDLPPWERLNRCLCGNYEKSGGKQVCRELTHRRQKLKENEKELASKNHEEIYGGALNNVGEERGYTRSIHMAPFSSRKRDNEESHAVFGEGGWPMPRGC